MTICDFLIVGGGIIGINVAHEIKRRFRDSSVIVVEKEDSCGHHASGRNSGVLHAGFYYTSDSLKARFTKNGNRLLTQYCELRHLPINKCGKLVVAAGEQDLPALNELASRGKLNDIPLETITAREAERIEPRVLTCERALYSPTTSSVNPLDVVSSMVSEAKEDGVQFHYDTRYISRQDRAVVTSKGRYEAGYLVNAAGLYADKVAKDYGFSQNYAVLPFKGLYLYSNEPVGSLRTNVYPVPNLKNPFLGVHFTVTVTGQIKIGPTAIPAFWREHYTGTENFKLREFLEIIKRELALFLYSSFDFARLSFEEIQKYSRKHLVSLASKLVQGVSEQQYRVWGKPGLRAQLVDTKKRCLEMDFVIEGDDQSLHVLNAVSPGFTCAIPFSNFICDQIQEKLK